MLRSADEVREEHIVAMGEDLGVTFHALSTELTWLHWCWHQYRVLFGTRETRVDLLNETAPMFFYLVQTTFFDATLLGIARLAGPARSVRKSNLALLQLPPLIKDQALRKHVAELALAAAHASAFAIDWRNKRLAHTDLALALGQQAKPLAAASRQAVEEALDAIEVVLNHVQQSYLDSTTFYRGTRPHRDAEALLYVVRDGLTVERERRARLERAEWRAEDLKPPEPI